MLIWQILKNRFDHATLRSYKRKQFSPHKAAGPLTPTNLPQHHAPTGDKRTVRNQGPVNGVLTPEVLRRMAIPVNDRNWSQ